jgi:putative ABC transport system substrate-binding protein
LELLFFKASTATEIESAFTSISRERAHALFIAPDGYFVSRGVQFATLTAPDRLPAGAFARESVEAGVLMSYGTSIADVFRQVGVYAGSILNGANPADLPVVQSPNSNSSSTCKLRVRLVSMSLQLCWRAPTR